MKRTIQIMIAVAVLIFTYQTARANSLQGLIVTESDKGIPGLTISLAHPTAGRSSPSITDSSGHYSFPNVPPRPDPYYLEVYWGKELLYRQSMVIEGDMTAPQIKLNRN